MNSRVFLDAGGLVAMLNQADWLHEKASIEFDRFERDRRSFVTTNLVLAETGNGLAKTAARGQGGLFIRGLLSDTSCKVVYANRRFFLSAIQTYLDYHDKTWGMVDCISFEVIRRHDIDEAFTADRHFEQAGFRCLIRSA